MSITPVILCGGSGTRLWPASRTKYPKQFMKLSDGNTLFNETLQRIDYFRKTEELIIVSNNDYRFYASEALKEVGKSGTIILEPQSRNTAPAIALAAFAALEKSDSHLLVLPSDHKFENPEVFCKAVENAYDAASQGLLVTFGIHPNRAESGYGYIQIGNSLGNGVFKVKNFLEKPAQKVAETLVASGEYYWNSGIFFFKASSYLDELKLFAPKIWEIAKKSWDSRYKDLSFIRPGQIFDKSPADSIDYAVMEHTTKATVIPVECGWSDLGSWEAFYEISKKDKYGNVCEGDVIAENTNNCYLRSSNRLIAAIDVNDLAVVETKDAVLITDRKKTQDVKYVVEKLKLDTRTEADIHLKVYRPWGSYETLVISNRFQVKRIIVNPGEENSLQLHYHRSEHWIIVSGTAEVTVDNDVKLLTENESIYISLGAKHRIKNPGTIPLVFIEVQSGAYLGEDDIIRFQDDYGRADEEEHI